MKNIKFILAIIAGFILISCLAGNDKNNTTSTPDNEIQPINHTTDFVYAAEQSIDAVVHIKSKIVQTIFIDIMILFQISFMKWI